MEAVINRFRVSNVDWSLSSNKSACIESRVIVQFFVTAIADWTSSENILQTRNCAAIYRHAIHNSLLRRVDSKERRKCGQVPLPECRVPLEIDEKYLISGGQYVSKFF